MQRIRLSSSSLKRESCCFDGYAQANVLRVREAASLRLTEATYPARLRLPQQRVGSPSLALAVLFFFIVIGFSVLFILLGASAGVAGRFLSAHREGLNRLAGAGIAFFGLALLRLLPFQFLNRDVRFQGEIRQGKFRSLLLGLAFAFGWTPCAGPVLAAMLIMAASRESAWHGTSLLAVYSAGMAMPFLLVALSISRFLSLYRRIGQHLVWVERFGGAMLVSVGVLLFFDKLSDIAFYLTRFNHLVW